MRKYVDSSIGQRTPFGMYANEPSLKTAELSVAKKLSVYGTTVPEILPHQLRMVLHRLGERAEDDAELRQLLLERRGHRDAVEHRVDRDAREQLLLVERDAELLEGPPDLRIDLVQALRAPASASARSSR